jgi:hypothetical protein
MNLPDTIYAHAQALPANLQRETLDFIAYLEHRYSIASTNPARPSTDAFIARLAGSVGEDFPDDISGADLPNDNTRDSIE